MPLEAMYMIDKVYVRRKVLAAFEKLAQQVKYYFPGKDGHRKEWASIKDKVEVEQLPKGMAEKVKKFAELSQDVIKNNPYKDAKVLEAQKALNDAVAAAKTKHKYQDKQNQINGLIAELKQLSTEVPAGYARVADHILNIIENKVVKAAAAEEVLKKLEETDPRIKKRIEEVRDSMSKGAESLLKDLIVINEKFLQTEEEEEKAPADKKPKRQPVRQPERSLRTDLHTGIKITADLLDGSLSDWQKAKDLMDEMAGDLAALDEQAQALDAESQEVEQFLAENADVEDAEDAEAPEADEAEEPGMMDTFMDMLAPAPQPAMAPAPASVADAWIKTASDETGLTAEADAKRYPADEDLSSNSFELVESDGKKQLLIKKDLKSKVTQKIQDHLDGKYRKAEKIAVDLGDRIVEASMVGYLGNGKYEVVAEGRSMRVPDGQIFRASDIWGA